MKKVLKGKSKLDVVVIVDAFSTGKYLSEEVKKRGFECVHVRSREKFPDVFAKNHILGDFVEEFYFNGKLEELRDKLSQYNVLAVINGCEVGVELSEALASRLSLPGNNPRTSHLRRDKFEMVNAVAQAGLLTARQFKGTSADSVLQWYQSNNFDKNRIVVKPLNSAGTDHVTFCDSESDVVRATSSILGKINQMGLLNEYVLAQSFLVGFEYVVNTVTVRGKHYLTDIWRADKERVEGAGFVPGCEVLLPFQGLIQAQLRDYVFNALDALDFFHGPAHFEIMLTDEGPALIEVGARLQGGVNPDVHFECMGSSQLIKTVDAYLCPEKFSSPSNAEYHLKKYSRWIDLISPKSGVLTRSSFIEEIKNLPSYYSCNINMKPGSFVNRTIDLYTTPGDIYLVHEDFVQLEHDYKKVREIERRSYEFVK